MRESQGSRLAMQPPAKFMPSYRMEPNNPFNRERCERILKNVVDSELENFSYSNTAAPELCQQISTEITTQVKHLRHDRYKYVCTVTIGEKCKQGYHSVVKFLWDAEKDLFVSYVYDRPNLFAMATIYALYFD